MECFDPSGHQASTFPPDNPKVIGTKMNKQEGKTIYSLKLECHDSSYLCTKENELREIDMMPESKIQ
jgi:hypothetical protein